MRKLKPNLGYNQPEQDINMDLNLFELIYIYMLFFLLKKDFYN